MKRRSDIETELGMRLYRDGKEKIDWELKCVDNSFLDELLPDGLKKPSNKDLLVYLAQASTVIFLILMMLDVICLLATNARALRGWFSYLLSLSDFTP